MGEPDVDALLESIPSKLLSEWMAYSQIEPFGWEAQNLLTAHLCCAVVAPHMKKGQTPKLDDWLIKFEPDQQTPEEMSEMLKVFTESRKKRRRTEPK